tara:strand:- start:137921 stop:138418 length:498 start_codon:yes stop_codon:yes gene_type:complete
MNTKDTGQEAPREAPQGVNVRVLAQYVKDISFENPRAPQSLQEQSGPKTDISFQIDTNEIKEEKLKDLYEVVLTVKAKAERDGGPVFICDVEYATLVSLEGVPEDKNMPLLFIEVPRISFPFVRRLIADLTQEGGFPPLLLNPVDFTALYVQKMEEEKAKGKQAN